MVFQGEGKGIFFLTSFSKYFGTKILSKWGGMIQIGSSYNFSSILVLFGWKKLEESTCRAILVVGPSLEN
jgi:hypothetical protein